MTATTTLILRPDQNLSKEGSIALTIWGMPWDANPEPRTMVVVQSIKIIVVVPNKNMDPGEWDKGPLELEERVRRAKFECSRGPRVSQK
jgi:hypothetical protein